MYHYIAYGLTIASEIILPELREYNNSQESDVTIYLGETPQQLKNPLDSHTRWQAKPNELLLTVDNVARYWVQNGKTITVTKYADDKSIRLFLLGSALGAILLQRAYLPLHANCIVHKGQAFAFSGKSGIGKSTLAAALMEKGFEILTDDICAIDFKEGKPKVFSAGGHIKLWKNSIDKLEYDAADLQSVRPEMQKYFYPVESLEPLKPYPLKAIYFLRQHNLPEICIENLPAKTSIKRIKNNTYREIFTNGLDLQSSNFQQHLQLASQCKIAQVIRPKIGFKLDELVQSIMKDIHEQC